MANLNEKLSLFKRARKEGWALGAFNFSNIEALKAIFRAAQNLKSPVIVQTSMGESEYLGLKQAAVLVRVFEAETGVAAILNLDHAKTLDYIIKAIEAGYDAVHFDGSKLPIEENIRATKEVVKICRKKGVMVEGEVGLIKGGSQMHKEKIEVKQEDLTDPQEATKFAEDTRVDNLAVSVGSFHGINSSGIKPINFLRLKEIAQKVGDATGLVLHGGSGVLEGDVKEAIKLGIVKININTELRVAFSRSLRDALGGNPQETTPYNYMPKAIEAIRKIVEDKIKLFNSVGKI